MYSLIFPAALSVKFLTILFFFLTMYSDLQENVTLSLWSIYV